MKSYEKELFKNFPELAYLVDYLWSPGSPEPWNKIIAVVDRIDNGNHPTVDQWMGDHEPDTVVSLYRGVGWDYSPLIYIHRDTPNLYPEDIDFGVKDHNGNWLLIASRQRQRIATTVGALLLPEIQEMVMGIFADDILPRIAGNMASVKISYEIPSVEEEKIKFLANAKALEERVRYQAEISRLEEELDNLQRETRTKIRNMLRTFMKARQQGWEIEMNGDEIIFKYPHRIPMTYFVYQGQVYDVPEEYDVEWYTQRMEVIIDRWGGVSVHAWGNHPNIGTMGNVCLGDVSITLENISDITTLPALMEMGNLDSPLNTGVFDDIVNLVIKGEKKKETKGFIINI